MILADTSIWVDYVNSLDLRLQSVLERAEVLMHPFIIGEVVLGNLRDRAATIRWMLRLPAAPVASSSDLLRFVEMHSLYGRGIGYVDAHLLASARLCGASLWTLDRRLSAAAVHLGVAFSPVQ